MNTGITKYEFRNNERDLLCRRFSRLSILPAAVIVFFCVLPSVAFPQNYGRTIITQEPDERLEEAIGDLSSALEEMTGEEFEILTAGEDFSEESPAIVISQTGSDLLPPEQRGRLDDTCRESFLISSSDDDRLWIAAGHSKGLSHGIYYYLEKLGARWYFPNPNWEIIPGRDDITVRVDKVVEPAFLMRTFFGTGGFGPGTPVDPSPRRNLGGRWERWQQRNRFGAQMSTYGHVGHAFSIRYEEEFRENPEYRAEVDGERVDYSPGVKFCGSNPEVVQLFIKDRLEALRDRREEDHGSIKSRYVGVGPADGYGFCRCEDCQSIGSGSISDQVFHVTNEVARAVADEFPGKDYGVSIYAYGQYAELPTIDLEPNMQICVIPYAFQRTGMSGDELLEAWLERMEAEGITAPPTIYDYWNITDWGRNMPDFDFRSLPRDRVRLWHELGIKGAHLESTYSAAAAGLGLLTGCRAMWDPDADIDSFLDEFYELSFGAAADPMRRMIERWAEDFVLSDHELAVSFRDLEEAYERADSEAAEMRIGDYVQYVQFLRKWHKFHRAQDDEIPGSARALVRILWSIYDSSMVHSYRMWILAVRSSRHRADYDTLDYLHAHEADEEPGWEEVTEPGRAKLQEWVDAGLKDYEPMDFQRRTFKGDPIPLEYPQPLEQAPEADGSSYRSRSTTNFHLYLPEGMDMLPIKLGGENVAVSVYDSRENKIFEHSTGESGKNTIEIPIGDPGYYRLTVRPTQSFHLTVPENIPAAFEPWREPIGWVRGYFYVPDGLDVLALINPPRNVSATLRNPEGGEIELKPQDAPLHVVEVPQGMDGAVWSLHRPGTASPVRLLNAPELFSLSEEAVMIFEDAR